MRKNSLLFGFVMGLLTFTSSAQVAQNVVVEHFTNTRCGSCASRNPAFFTNLESKPEILHLAVHPSRPYSTCVLNKHNKEGNDSRTNFYGIYGSTPRLVIQGKVISSSTNYGTSTLFDSYLSKTSPFSIKATTIKSDKDSLTAQVVIKTEATHNYSSLKVFIVAVEDTLQYAAPNGENEHYDVYRRTLVDQTIDNPSVTVGDSIVINVRTASHVDWNIEQMYTMAIVQDVTSEEVIQVNQSNTIKSDNTANVDEISLSELVNVYPNPVNSSLSISLNDLGKSEIIITNVSGQTVYSIDVVKSVTINTSNWTKGVYFLNVYSNKGTVTKKVVKY